MSGEGIRLNGTTPAGQVLNAVYDADEKTWTLVVKGNHEDEGIFVTQDLAHVMVHECKHFAYINAQDVGGSTTLSFVIAVPDTPYVPHLEFFVDGEAEYSLEIYEGAVPQAIGTIVTNPAVFNRNRNCPDTNGVKIYGSPTLGAGTKGTLKARLHAGSGKLQGGQTRGDNEIILRRNTNYWVDLINATASNNYISWVADWYEREP